MSDSDVDPEEDSSCASDEGGSESRDLIPDTLDVPSGRREVDDRAADCGVCVKESGAPRLVGEAALPNDRLDRRSRNRSCTRTERDADRADEAGDAPAAPAGAFVSSWPKRSELVCDDSDIETSLSLEPGPDGFRCETSTGSGVAAADAVRRRSHVSADTDASADPACRDCDAGVPDSGTASSGLDAERPASADGDEAGERASSSALVTRGLSAAGAVACAPVSCASMGFAAENTG